MTATLAARERSELCDLALSVGPDAPTLCEGWSVRDLVLHLVTRDRPWLAVRKPTPPLPDQSFDSLVSQAREPAKAFAFGPVEKAMNTVEFFVHHEDIRRAQPSWSPRSLSSDDSAMLGRQLGMIGRVLGLKAGVPLVVDDGFTTRTLRRGDHPVRVSGAPGELLLFLFGRDAVRDLTFDGPESAIDKLKGSNRGF